MKQRFSTRTRLVSALLTLAMVFTFLPFSAFAEEELTDNYGIIPLAEYVLPDKAFREYLKQFDTNNDDILAPAERYAVTTIDVSEKNISNLFGIQFFPNLKMLYCDNNQLTELDVRKNTALVYLDCAQNQLTELDVRQNAALWGLFCDRNQLSSLDVSNNTALDRLDCHLNNLTSLDLRYNTKLKQLGCDSNNLTSLDVSQNPELWLLNCSINQLTELDVSQNTALKELYCKQNRLTSLQADNCTKLTTLDCGNNVYNVKVYEKTRVLDPGILPGNFDISRVRNLNGAAKNADGTLTVNPVGGKVTYEYLCYGSTYKTFTLNVTETDDPNAGTVPPVTPPSGGGSTGGGSTGGGSTGGGSTGGGTVPPVTPPSGGGTTIPPEAGKYQLTVTDGVATVNGSTGAVLNVTPGDTVTLTADTTKFPENEEFGWWEISPYGSVSNTLTGQYQRTATFTMPPENVSARAMSKTAGVSTGGDGGGDGAAILLVGGAAVAGLVGYGVYSYVSEQQLKALLPEGVAMPENRAQTALLLWNTAGRPEPAAQPAFPDVADPDTAKAAQWCVEQGLMNAKFRGRFAPDGSSPAYKTLNAYRQLVG